MTKIRDHRFEKVKDALRKNLPFEIIGDARIEWDSLDDPWGIWEDLIKDLETIFKED